MEDNSTPLNEPLNAPATDAPATDATATAPATPAADSTEDYGVGITDAMADEMIRKLTIYYEARRTWLCRQALNKARETYNGDSNAALRSLTTSKTATLRWASLRALERIPVLTNEQFIALTSKYTAQEIADGIGCSVSTVHAWRKTAGQHPIRNKWSTKVIAWLKTK